MLFRSRSRLVTVLAASALFVVTGIVQAHGKKTEGSDTHSAVDAEIDREQRPFGVAAAPAEASRTVDVVMNDTMRFIPASIDVARGETVTISVANEGMLLHEFVLGTQDTLDEHSEIMKKYPGMEHSEPYMAHVSPGDVTAITWTFNQDTTVRFACLVAGHYEAGMVGDIDLVTAQQ